jgi:hypothetical protein
MVREGIKAYRAGRKEEAKALLMRAVELDQYNEMGWIWLSAVVETPEEQRTCLENVLVINPTNETARKGLDVLAQKTPAAPPPPPQQAADILAGASFTAPPVPLSAPAPPAAPEEELPSINWQDPGIATSSASARHSIDELSADDYDDWVKDLGLGGRSPTDPVQTTQDLISATLFGNEEDEDGLPDAAPAAMPPPTPRREPAPALDDNPFDGPFSSESVDDINSMLNEFRNAPEAPPAPIPDDIPSPIRDRRKNRPPVESPAPIHVQRALEDKDTATELLNRIETEEDYDQAEFDKVDPDEYFRFIPAEITPTRLPGTNERYPALVILGLLVLVAANIGAVYLLVAGAGA